jgi:hypothetical protein
LLCFSNKWVTDKGKFKYFVDFLNPPFNNSSSCNSFFLPQFSYTELESFLCQQVSVDLSFIFTFILGQDNDFDKSFLDGIVSNSYFLDITISQLLKNNKVVEIWIWKFLCPGKFFYLNRKFGSNKNFKLFILEDYKNTILFTKPRTSKKCDDSSISDISF